MRLDEADLLRAFGAATLERAREYVRKGRVLEAFDEGTGRVRGMVKGSEWKPYEQKIAIDGHAVDGLCTCPVGENCKHVAAVLLDLSGQDEEVEIEPTKADPNVAKWLESLRDVFADPNAYPPDVPGRVVYVLSRDEKGFSVELMTTRALKGGGFGRTSRMSLNPIYSKAWPAYVRPVDVRLIETLVRTLGRTGYDSRFRLTGADGGRLLPEIAATGRCVWESLERPPLVVGPARAAGLAWRASSDGGQALGLDAPGVLVVPTVPALYVDLDGNTVGALDLGLPAPLLTALLAAPTIRPESVGAVREAVARLVPDRADLLPAERRVETRPTRPVPVFRVEMLACTHQGYGAWRKPAVGGEHRLPVGRLAFDYDGTEVKQGASGSEIRRQEGDAVVVVPRRPRLEGRANTPLLTAGWTGARQAYNWRLPSGHGDDYLFPPEDDGHPESFRAAFYRFVRGTVPALREAGWRVELEEGLDLIEPTEWHVEARADGADWFDLDLGVIVEGERVPLLPILLDALKGLGGTRPESLKDDAELYVPGPNGRTLALPGARVRPLLTTLNELFGRSGGWPDDLRVPRAAVGELAVLDEAGLSWKAPKALKDLKTRLASFDRLRSIAPPKGLKGDLRPYQAQGLAWLQFLREYGFGGVLADDMGLGKTVQTLAHVLIEQEAGRLDRPALIVAPTSTLPNWRAEAERFAPSLKTLVLRGAERHDLFETISEHDLVVTSYPLLARDLDELRQHPFHLIVLDEAQNVKNPAAAAAKAAKALDTHHRVCLSGTPVENRLEELWSLFDFAMPGFLGGLTRFRKEFRTPIESHGDEAASRRLARRVRPFVLRRTKDLVAKELPKKTTLVERVELTGAQRDLYEGLRLAMDARVRDLLAAKGFQKGRIEILDALLKLRQACNDPRLVRLDAAQNVSGSAKLDRLMELLGELLAEGRRILVFSQFTSMLDLIEERLRDSLPPSGEGERGSGSFLLADGGSKEPTAKQRSRRRSPAKTEGASASPSSPIPPSWLRLDGSTEDRETPVKRFQSGEVPLFLISLRAGGTGLNLTAADTVIHVDPWWNPAVEAQATDRAHRIGQTKRVLVLKLIAEGTVEEKILEFQERKAKLAEAVLGGELDAALTADDMKALFDA